MHVEHENVFLLIEPDHHAPQQRATRQIERCPRLGLTETLRLCLARSLVLAAQIDAPETEVNTIQDALLSTTTFA